MLEERLEQALRLAIDPPGGLNTAALRDLIRDDENTQWDIATTAEYLGISAHTLRYYERAELVKVGRDASGYRLYDAAAVRRLVLLPECGSLECRLPNSSITSPWLNKVQKQYRSVLI